MVAYRFGDNRFQNLTEVLRMMFDSFSLVFSTEFLANNNQLSSI